MAQDIAYFSYEQMAGYWRGNGRESHNVTYDWENTSGRTMNSGVAPPRLAIGPDGKRTQGAWAGAHTAGFNMAANEGTPGFKLKDKALAALEGFRAKRELAALVAATEPK